MIKSTTDASREADVTETISRSIQWNGQYWEYYKKLMELMVRKKSVAFFKIMTGDTVFDENRDTAKTLWWDGL